jgi:hypothetical protein
MKFTVIGYYESNGEAFADHVEGDDAFAAMTNCANALTDSDLWIVGAIAGEHELVTPGDDNNKIACATDLEGE